VKKKTFRAEVLSGHKENAVEVPFDPSEAWAIPPKPLWRGRRGYAVKGSLNGTPFESFIVPRSQRFYLLIDIELSRVAGVKEGDKVAVSVAPSPGHDDN